MVLKFLNDITDLLSLVLQIQRLSRTPLVWKQVWHFKGFLGCPSSKISICDSFPGRLYCRYFLSEKEKELYYFFSYVRQATFGNKLLGKKNNDLLSQLPTLIHPLHPCRARYILSGKNNPPRIPEQVWCRSNRITLVSSKAQG